MIADAIFFGAHPDDAELLAGGMMARLAAAGRTVVLADATHGEFSSRGTVEERAAEAAEAARILGVHRTNLGLPDGGISHDMAASVRAVVRAIREFQPRLVFTHVAGDHHPDHNALSAAVKQAFFMSNLLKYDTGQERFQAKRLYYFWSNRHETPPQLSFVTDITPVWEKKVEAIRAHTSQFHNPAYEGPKTFVSSEQFWRALEARASYFGSLVGVRFGEPFISEGILRIDDPSVLPDVSEGSH